MAHEQPSLFPDFDPRAPDEQPEAMSDNDWESLAREAGLVFTPTTPISRKDLFAGRIPQVRAVLDVVNTLGQHAIMYGERGVGKTSLANVLSQFLGNSAIALSPRVNSDVADTFDSVWRKAFDQIEMSRAKAVGFGSVGQREYFNPAELTAGELTPDAVRRILIMMSADAVPIIIFDEFDQLPSDVRATFAGLIKTLSDQSVEATIILVGVGETIEQLIASHESVARALVQIHMQRMDSAEIEQIIDAGLLHLGMRIEPSARRHMVLLSQGLPYYTHLVSLHAVRTAVDFRTLTISDSIVQQAIAIAIEKAQSTIRRKYDEATTSPKKENLFPDVLLACALAQTDDLGYFFAKNVVPPLRDITQKNYGIPTFAQHLQDFSSAKRGNVLVKEGVARRWKFRFRDPLMQPYVMMQGIAQKRISESVLAERAEY